MMLQKDCFYDKCGEKKPNQVYCKKYSQITGYTEKLFYLKKLIDVKIIFRLQVYNIAIECGYIFKDTHFHSHFNFLM